MKGMSSKSRLMMWLMCFLALTAILSAIPASMADDRKGGGKRYDKHAERRSEGLFGGLLGKGEHDKGDESTGQIAAWSLAAANLTVALSALLKGVKRFIPLGPDAQKSLSKFNVTQKNYLMRLHYALNPAVLLLAILHWTLSRCRSTALPEWGLLIMGGIIALGVVLKFKLCPKGFLRNIYRIHTQPVLFLILISMLVIGHLSMD